MNVRIYVYEHFSKWPMIERYDNWTDVYIFWSVIRVFRKRVTE